MELNLQKAQGEDGHVLVRKMEMEDPTFESATTHVATATFQNPKTTSFDYQAQVYLGKTLGNKVVFSPVKAFTLLPGATRAEPFSVTMPTLAIPSDTFKVYLEVKHAGVVIITFIATEDVAVIVTPAINVTQIVWG